MTTTDIFKIIFGIIGTLVAVGTLVLGFIKFFGDFFANKYIEKIKANFQKEINEYTNQLEILKHTSIRFSDKQFEHYSLLWSSLSELKFLSDDLWVIANSVNLDKFSKQLTLTKKEIEKSSLFIKQEDYEELIKLIKTFSNYQIGKKDLIEYRRQQYFDTFEVERMKDENRQTKVNFDSLILKIKLDLKKKIGEK